MLGPYRIAHYLREHNWDAEVIEYGKFWSFDELKQLAKSRITEDTKFFGFSQLFPLWSETTEMFCAWLKIEYPNLVLISGSSVLPAASTHIDYYVTGFGEQALIVLLKWLFSNGERPRFNLRKNNGKLTLSGNDQYPAFPMKSLMVKYEDRDFIIPEEWLTIEFARGCKFHCDFCNFPVLGVKGDYSRDADDAREQLLDAYERFGVTNYQVADETFNDRTEKITKFADVVETLPFTPWFSGFIRADLMISRPKDREELLRMNFLGHHYGIETFNQEAAKAISKGMKPERVKQGLLDIREYFENNGRKLYRGHCTFIVGLPGESIPDIHNTFQWLVDNWSGQTYEVYPLGIPAGVTSTVSKIGLDTKKYGYETEPMPAAIQQGADISGGNLLIWKNKHMHMDQATALARTAGEILNDPANNFKLHMWSLSAQGIGTTMEERLQQPANLLAQGLGEVALKQIEEYKQKKLNLF